MEPRIVPVSAIPTVGLTVPSQALIGSTVQFTASFENSSASQAGYGPFIDLEMPSVGTGTNNGLAFTGATYLGSPVSATVETFDGSGHANKSLALDTSGNPVVVSGTPGDQLVILTLPFGSVTPGQPRTDVTIDASMSDQATLDTPLNISATGGFEFGNDALNDPSTDPSILGASASASVTPTLVSVEATYLGPEQETATGPNSREPYRITASVAPGQTINNFQLNDILPAGMQFVSIGAVSANGSTSHSTVATPSTSTPGGTLSVRFDKVVGTGGASDASMTFTFYVPRDDSSSNPVLDLGTSAFATLQDQANANGSWTPAGGTTAISVTAATATDTITAKSIAVQQSVVDLTNPASPRSGDVLQYTIQFQVTDFFALSGAVADASFSDGQAFDSSFAPTLSFTRAGSTSGAAFLAANYAVGPQDTSPSDGSTPIAFDISIELAALGISGGDLLGASIPAGGTGGPEPSASPSKTRTVGTIVYETTIQQQFHYNCPTGEPYAVEGDVLDGGVTATGNVLSYSDLATTATTQTDDSGTQVKIPRGVLSESIYAIDGNTSVGPTPKIAAGDTITYEVKYDLPTSNVDDMSLSSFLPLPINVATGITAFNAIESATAPAVGQAQFGPSDTLYGLSGIAPTVGTDGTANSVTFDYGSYHDANQDATVLDILLTVSVSSQPFADGLILTNEAQEVEGSTNGGTAMAESIVQLELTEPVLTITHGIVATDDSTATAASSPYNFSAPGSSGPRFSGTINSGDLATSPIIGGLSGLQAGDLATFAIVVQDDGSGLNGAFDVALADSLPAGFVVPASGLNLSVTDGTGAALSVANVGGGTGLFGQGIEVTNPNASLGTLSAYGATSGTNLLVITYDLQAANTITPTESIPVQASLTGYSASEGGPHFVSTPATATATATTPAVAVTKVIASSNQSFTTGSKLAIGEIATYDVTIAIPEGVTPSAQLVDTLPAGLAIVQVDSIIPSSGVATSSSTSTIASNGSSVTFDLGTITYEVVVLNVSGNQQGTTLTNSAEFTYTGGSASASATATVVVRKLTLAVTASQATA